jgi:hypothetical protein
MTLKSTSLSELSVSSQHTQPLRDFKEKHSLTLAIYKTKSVFYVHFAIICR